MYIVLIGWPMNFVNSSIATLFLQCIGKNKTQEIVVSSSNMHAILSWQAFTILISSAALPWTDV